MGIRKVTLFLLCFNPDRSPRISTPIGLRLRKRLTDFLDTWLNRYPRGVGPRLAASSPTLDYQLGNWLVVFVRPLYLRVNACLRCPLDDRHRPSRTLASDTQRARQSYAQQAEPERLIGLRPSLVGLD